MPASSLQDCSNSRSGQLIRFSTSRSLPCGRDAALTAAPSEMAMASKTKLNPPSAICLPIRTRIPLSNVRVLEKARLAYNIEMMLLRHVRM